VSLPFVERFCWRASAVIVLAICLLLAAACGNDSITDPDADAASAVLALSSEVLSVESIRLTAANHYLDLRYRVLDPDQANEHLGPGVESRLIDQSSGIVNPVPMTAKLGALRQTRGIQKTGRQYFVLFANNAGLRRGSVVTAEIGDFRFENLTIE
jgi:hypothetical protein